MAEEIATEHRVTVRRPNRDFLMQIRRGEFEYDDLISQAEEKIERINAAFEKSDLRDEPDTEELERVLVKIHEQWYRQE
jgi:predicted nucleic acid-binding OB-fold protein